MNKKDQSSMLPNHRVRISGSQLYGKNLEINCPEHGLAEAKLKISPKTLWSMQLRDLALQYFQMGLKKRALMKITLIYLLSILRRTPNNLVKEFLWTYRAEFLHPENCENNLALSVLGETEKLWISRNAVMQGVVPLFLGAEIERSRVREYRKFAGFVWELDGGSKLGNMNSLGSRKLKITKVEDIALEKADATISFHELLDISIHHGEVAIKNSSYFPTDSKDYFHLNSWPTEKVFQDARGSYFAITPDPSVYLQGDYLFVGSNVNWFHFNIELLPLIINFKNSCKKKFSVVLNKNCPSQIIDLCNEISGKPPILISHGESIKFEKITIGNDSRYSEVLNLFDRAQDMRLVKALLLGFLEFEDKSKSHARIYIKRPRDLFRQSSNISKVEELLVGIFGFRAVSPESLTFTEQIGLFHDAEIVVGESGAALTNLMFCREGTKIIELQAPFDGGDRDFWKTYSQVFNLEHLAVIGSYPIWDRNGILDRHNYPVSELSATLQEICV